MWPGEWGEEEEEEEEEEEKTGRGGLPGLRESSRCIILVQDLLSLAKPPPLLPLLLLLLPLLLSYDSYYNFPSLWKDLPQLLKECRARGITTSLSPQYDASEVSRSSGG